MHFWCQKLNVILTIFTFLLFAGILSSSFSSKNLFYHLFIFMYHCHYHFAQLYMTIYKDERSHVTIWYTITTKTKIKMNISSPSLLTKWWALGSWCGPEGSHHSRKSDQWRSIHRVQLQGMGVKDPTGWKHGCWVGRRREGKICAWRFPGQLAGRLTHTSFAILPQIGQGFKFNCFFS